MRRKRAEREKTVIDLTNSLLDKQTAEAMRALEQGNDPPVMFRRGTGLAEIVLDDSNCPVIQQMTHDDLRRRLAEVCDFVRVNRFGRQSIPPPSVVVNNILAQPSWCFPTLGGVAEVPFLRPDGTHCIEPGYDPATELYYSPEPGLHVQSISPTPGPDEVEMVTCSPRCSRKILLVLPAWRGRDRCGRVGLAKSRSFRS
jgi:hypothetical protein